MAIGRHLSILLAAATALAPSQLAAAVVHPQRLPGPEYLPRQHDPADSADVIRETHLVRRATSQSPKGYTPSPLDCPRSRPRVRDGSSLSPQEREWLPRRRNETVAPIRDLLRRIAIPNFDSEAYLKDAATDPTALPNIGLAVSGGGYRAMLNGAGAVAAWDSRSTGSQTKGNLGGLLQSATYISGLSGGSWLVGSMYSNNFTSVQDAVNAPQIWQFDDSILKGPQLYSLLQYYSEIIDDVKAKAKAGFDTSITDYWGRMLSYQLVNATNGGPGFTYSSIADDPGFSSGKTPLPFIIADGRAPGQKIIASNSTIFEFTPWEFGSFDPSLQGFVPLQYVGSNFTNGSIPDNESCVVGFDNAGFVMGTSSSLFNQIVLYIKDGDSRYVPEDIPKFVVNVLTSLLNSLGDSDNDIADWTPNPFKGWNTANNPSARNTRLTLVDGGEDLQNIPYHPHLFHERNVDVVFSIDSSADTDSSWPDGASAIATYERSLQSSVANGTGFPAVPGKNTFINLGLNSRPAFFGCQSSNLTKPSPLIVYIPNYPYLYESNISTFQMAIRSDERDAIVQNGWAVATQLNSTRDPDWAACVGCAMLARSFERTRATVPDKCTQCYTNYCWNGTLNETKPEPYAPRLYTKGILIKSSGAPGRELGSLMTAVGLAALAVAAF
ncbi:Lysophospholipase, catalytic domain protein [Metarhizium album ARSEF 1941]|uniref:Lysophospholipase n=1 Tax=Metarhizium album (strain ARSEF 1941) TaxID=1081103 RepID=A0A0B2WTD2_METAS|nr:Lysophospholipase, catalytic domain protein [Metarhizium album ARSEF 1941]KHN97268.1 Lysophospholipase, catalytic domain protein [Metarhizium album ARSEF 1941]